MRDWSGCNSQAVGVARREPKWYLLPPRDEPRAPSTEEEPPAQTAGGGGLRFPPSLLLLFSLLV